MGFFQEQAFFFFFLPHIKVEILFSLSVEFQTGSYSHHACKSYLTVQSRLHEERTST